MLKIPLNRVVAFAGPYIAVTAGGVAAWLAAKVNVAGIPGLDQQNLATELAAGGTFLLTSALTWLGHSKWLTGHHVEMQADAAITAAALAPVAPEEAVTALADGTLMDDEAETASSDVTDEVEFASPPLPDFGETPVQPSQDE